MASQATFPEGPRGLVRSLLALPELGLRVIWLREKLAQGCIHEASRVLDETIGAALNGTPAAREALLPVALSLVQSRDTALAWALTTEAKKSALLNLERMMRPAPEPNSAGVHADREPRVPNYGTGRELTVGERRTMARRPTRLQIERLLLDPHPLVLEQVLSCPGLTEQDVIAVITRRPPPLVALESVVTFPRWMVRRRVRLALVLNPGCPHGIAAPLVATFLRDDLRLIVDTTTTSRTLRTIAHELLQRLPPLRNSNAVVH